MQCIYGQNPDIARWTSAHRQTVLESSRPLLSPGERHNMEDYIRSFDISPEARWRDVYSNQRPSIALSNLLNRQADLNQHIARLSRQGDGEGSVRYASEHKDPIDTINGLFQQSNMPIRISISEGEDFLASKNGSVSYGVNELSDGERNGLLIASEVLTAPPNSLLLIDEPERHLHRSIISPLLTALFSERADCSFVISTHEVMLPIDNPSSRTLLLRGCVYDEHNQVSSWDITVLEAGAQIDNDIKADILGSRSRILFVEGEKTSLDAPLYSMLFPNVSVISKQDSRTVEIAVRGVNSSNDLHSLSAYGIIDRDWRTEGQREKLSEQGIYSLGVYSVESIYYDYRIQEAVVVQIKAEQDAQQSLASAKEALIQAVSNNRQHLVDQAIVQKIRQEITGLLPDKQNLPEGAINARIDVTKIRQTEEAALADFIQNQDVASIIARYPVRESSAFTVIAQTLGFTNREHYEKAVREMLKGNPEMLEYARSFTGPLAQKLSAPAATP